MAETPSPIEGETMTTILEKLGVIGWNHLAPQIIASLATESTLLLVGSHGTAKSMLLENLAAALHLEFRHYNASILNFDDLIGFPAPDGDTVKYLRSPLDAWNAQAIFIDEISRCRPDMQNRLFPLVHECKLQGKKLERLRFRWSAMNPPPSDDDPDSYLGTNALDRAFADRFSWVLPIPKDLNAVDRLRVIYGVEFDKDAGIELKKHIRQTQGRLHVVKEVYGSQLAEFVSSVWVLLKRSGLEISFRRSRMIFENIIALIATGFFEDVENAALRGLLYSLPQTAEKKIEKETVIRIFKTAWQFKDFSAVSIQKALIEEQNPIKRIAIALPSQSDDLITATILDSIASISKAERLILSSQLFPILIENFPEISAIVLETLAIDVAEIESLVQHNQMIKSGSLRYQQALNINKVCASLKGNSDWIEDILWSCFKQELSDDPWILAERAVEIKQVLASVTWRQHA